MKIISISTAFICLAIFINCSKEKIIELPLIQVNGYGYFHPSLGGISPYTDKENNPWGKTYLNVSGAPEGWTDIKYGDIETNIYQSVYQNYILGNITKDKYEELQKSWDWKPDTLELSREPLKTKIAFAFGKDAKGEVRMIVDANNNLDFSDDESFIPYNIAPNESPKLDSLAEHSAIDISYERFIDNKKVLAKASLFIAYLSRYDIFMCNFSQYSIANFNGEKIAVCSDGFTSLSYKKPSIVLMNDNIKDGDRFSHENLIAINEYIEIKGKLYKNLGVNLNRNTLVLKEIDLPKNELYSTQVGFKSIPFEGNDFITESPISLNELQGKFVLLDFWAVWCGPCIQEIPHLKELYEKTDRDKFEIIGIVGASPPDALRKIIEKDSISWVQILSTDTNKIKEDYGVHGYPTTFLLDPEGIIIAKNLRGKELEDKVLGLINK